MIKEFSLLSINNFLTFLLCLVQHVYIPISRQSSRRVAGSWASCRLLMLVLLSSLISLRIRSCHGLAFSTNVSSAKKKIIWFRDHALRVNNNKALVSAVENCIVDSSLLIPVFLWGMRGSISKNSSLSLPIDERTGGTAKDVFVTNALKDLNNTLHGSLSLGSVPEDSISVAKELVSLCKKSGANEIYYLKSFDEKLEEDIEKRLLENGISPKPFVNAFTLIDYSIHNVPW